jgi:hypothetical protein
MADGTPCNSTADAGPSQAGDTRVGGQVKRTSSDETVAEHPQGTVIDAVPQSAPGPPIGSHVLPLTTSEDHHLYENAKALVHHHLVHAPMLCTLPHKYYCFHKYSRFHKYGNVNGQSTVAGKLARMPRFPPMSS